MSSRGEHTLGATYFAFILVAVIATCLVLSGWARIRHARAVARSDEGFFDCLANPNSFSDVTDSRASTLMSMAYSKEEETLPCMVQGVAIPGFTSLRSCDLRDELSASSMNFCRIPRGEVRDQDCRNISHPILKTVKESNDHCVVEFHSTVPASVMSFVDQLTPPPPPPPPPGMTDLVNRHLDGSISKTVGGVTYYLLAAHKAFNYAGVVSDTDRFFRNMFTQTHNGQLTTLDQVLSMPGDGPQNCYSNAALAQLTCRGYLLEAYNPNKSKFPAWGTIDTEPHTWASLASRGATYQAPALSVIQSRLYSSSDIASPVSVRHVAVLTTSKNGASSQPTNPFVDDAGDFVLLGLSTQAFQAGDGYDVYTFGSNSTCIGFGMSDGSGVGITMEQYHRRSTYAHCTAMSNGQGITPGRQGGSHGGADRIGFFLLWGALEVAAGACAAPTSYVQSTVASFQPGLRYQVFSISRATGNSFDTLLAQRAGMELASGVRAIDFPMTSSRWGGDPLLSRDFGLVMSGFLNVSTTRNYTFYALTADGLHLTVDNTVIIDRLQEQGPTVHSGTVRLSAGRVAIRVKWFDVGGHKVLRLGWDGPGISTVLRESPRVEVNLIPPEAYSYI